GGAAWGVGEDQFDGLLRPARRLRESVLCQTDGQQRTSDSKAHATAHWGFLPLPVWLQCARRRKARQIVERRARPNWRAAQGLVRARVHRKLAGATRLAQGESPWRWRSASRLQGRRWWMWPMGRGCLSRGLVVPAFPTC